VPTDIPRLGPDGTLIGGRFDKMHFSPDSKRVLSIGGDSVARLWDASTAKKIAELRTERHTVAEASFDPSGKAVFTINDESTVQRWDATNGKLLGDLIQNQGKLTGLAFSPDGKLIVTGGENARLWDATTGKSLGRTLQHPGGVGQCLVFSPDSKMVLTSGRDKSVHLWDAATGEPVSEPLPHQREVTTASFSPDGTRFLTGTYAAPFSGDAFLWDARARTRLANLKKNALDAGVAAAAFNPDNKTILTINSANTAQLWDAKTGTFISNLFQHPDSVEGPVRSLAISSDGKVILTGAGDSARLWDSAIGKPLGTPLQLYAQIWSVAFSPDNKKILVGTDRFTGRLWNAPTIVPGNPERITLWVQVLTGLELDHGVTKVLRGKAWEERRQLLAQLGGPPVP
jgi:WD40 repeat protein